VVKTWGNLKLGSLCHNCLDVKLVAGKYVRELKFLTWQFYEFLEGILKFAHTFVGFISIDFRSSGFAHKKMT